MRFVLTAGVACLTALCVAWPAVAVSPLLKEIEDAFVRLHEEVGPAVVNIEIRGSGSEMPEGMEDLFHFFNIPVPEEQSPRSRRSQATGSGFIFDAQGHIVTNNHVIAEAESITVRMYDGSEYAAELVGADPDTDLAVIKINANRDLPVARLGSTENLKVGQFAIAIGSPRQLEGTVSFGHISAMGRDGLAGLQSQGLRFQNLIQTDAAINLGNSGGPLCNIEGEVIGINTAIIWGANSIGFAIPVETAKNVIPQLISTGRVVRGFLGVGIEDAGNAYDEALNLPDPSGAFVKEVRPDTPAEAAGIEVYDVIRKVNGKVVRNASDLVNQISSYSPGETIVVEVWRDEKAIDIEVNLAEWQPRTQVAQAPREKDVLGMSLRNLTEDVISRMGLDSDAKGVLITQVKPGSPAEDARLSAGDVILEVARETVESVEEVRELIEKEGQPGKALLIRFSRSGGDPDITVLRIPED